jgi:saccharopine dehydrogenase-like NADP-dependent oxidoreductase
MRHILLIGAGRSSSFLIKYFLENSQEEEWILTVGDISLESAQQKIGNRKNSRPIAFDINDETQRRDEISKADLVVSMLPAHMHLPVAKECVVQKKHLVTASYITKEMQDLHVDAIKADIILLNECGLDPGIDHMSAMHIIDHIKAEGSEVVSFKSYTGGLVAPESNDNPWGYKFSWNPRNVILAGQGTAKYIEDGEYKYIPYNRLYSQIEKIEVDGYGSFDGYANRDSLSYRKIYGLNNIPTMLRGTLRQQGYCKAWNIFVQLGLTDDTYAIENSNHLTYAQLIEAYLPDSVKGDTVKSRLAAFINTSENNEEIKKVEWTGVLENKFIELKNATPAQILQQLLEEKWKLKEGDKDMIVMAHHFQIKDQRSKIKNITSSLVVKGDDSTYTAMAKTVGLPAAIAAKNILNGNIKIRGVHVPVQKEIYEPVLKELEGFGIRFTKTGSR